MMKRLLTMTIAMLSVVGVWADDWYGSEEVVSEATTWIFNGWETADNVYTANNDWRVVNKLYARSISGSNRYYSVKEIGSNTELTFSDGTEVNVSKYVQTNTAASVGGSSSCITAGQTGTNDVTPLLAFNTSAPGTVYAFIQEVGEDHNTSYRQRIYIADPYADSKGFASKLSNEGAKALGIEEIKYINTHAGAYAIGSTGSPCKIYAIRFVPETVTAPTIKNNNGTITITAGTSSISSAVKTYYTTNGDDPTAESTEYTEAFAYPAGCTQIKAISISQSTPSTSSDITTKDVPTIPTALAANSLNFAGLATSSATMDDAANFNTETEKKFITNSANASSIYVNGVIFSYSTNNSELFLRDQCIQGNKAAASITIPGLVAGQKVFAKVAGTHESNQTTYSCTGGEFITNATPVAKLSYNDASDILIRASGGNLVINNADQGFRLFRLALVNTMTVAVAEGQTAMGTAVVTTPTVPTTATITDAALGNNYYVKGSSVTVTATPNTGYRFVNWKNGDAEVSTDAAYTFDLNEDVALTANFAKADLALTDGSGEHGSVSFTVGGNAATTAQVGDEVTIVVTPATGYQLQNETLAANYNDGEAKTADISESKFTMPAYPVSVGADFSKIKYALTSTATNGTVVMKKDNAEGADITSGTEIEWGTTVYVSATPTSDAYYFTSLKYGDTDLTNGGTFTMPQAATAVTAVYTAKTAPTYTAPTYSALTYTGEAQNLVSAGSTEQGTIKYATSETGDYSTTIPQGTNAGDYTVWYKVEGDALHTDIAATQVENVKINKATLTATAQDANRYVGAENPEFSVEVTGFVNSETAETAAGYTSPTATCSATTVSVAGTYDIVPANGAATNYTFNYVNGTLTVNAQPTYTITGVTADEHGNKVEATPTSATAGTPVTLTITTATTPTNYTLKSISATGVTLSGTGNTRTFTMPAANVTVSATWVETSSIDPKTEIEEEANVGETSAEITNVNIGENTTEVSISGTIGGRPVTSIAAGTFTAENTANVQSIDLSNTQVALTGDARGSGSPLQNVDENTIIYLPNTSSATGVNVVKSDGTCAEVKIKETKAFVNKKGDITTSKFTFDRTFLNGDGQYNTVFLPVDIPSAAREVLGTFYTCTSVDESGAVLTEETGDLTANTAYIFKPATGKTTINYDGTATLTIKINDNITKPAGAGLKGTNVEGTIATLATDASKAYGYAAETTDGATVGAFYKLKSTATVPAYRAWLEVDNAAYGSRLGIIIDGDDTTGITSIDGKPVNEGLWFDIMGRKYTSKPTQKGVYILNGKKVVIK